MTWLVFIILFGATAFVGIVAAGLRGLGYEVGGDEEES